MQTFANAAAMPITALEERAGFFLGIGLDKPFFKPRHLHCRMEHFGPRLGRGTRHCNLRISTRTPILPFCGPATEFSWALERYYFRRNRRAFAQRRA